VFVLVRLPLLTAEASVLGWNGDRAIFGLMAKKIHDGRGLDIFFWGQNYMGPLTPALAAAIRRAILDPAGLAEAGGPLSLRLASMSEIAFGIGVFFLGLARLFGQPIAAIAGIWMAIGPPFFTRLSVLPMGPEMSFALGSVVFFLAAGALTRPRNLLDRPRGPFALGVLAGVGWWMNQTIVFVLAPVVVLVLIRSARPRARLVTSLLCGFALGYSPVWMGRLLGWYEPAAGAYLRPWQLSGLGPRLLRFFGADFWRLVGLDGLMPPPLAAAVLILLSCFLLMAARNRSAQGLHVTAAIVCFGAGVAFLKDFGSAGDRHLAPILPAALALLLVSCREAARLVARRVPHGLVALGFSGLALLPGLFLLRQARQVVAGVLLERDPRAPLEAIRAAGYTVCHAGYEMSYTLQFLSDERVRFIPHHSPDRNRVLSAALRSMPEPHCLVTDDGEVRTWLPSDAAQEGGPARRRAAGP
jgi:hypothetical protein